MCSTNHPHICGEHVVRPQMVIVSDIRPDLLEGLPPAVSVSSSRYFQ